MEPNLEAEGNAKKSLLCNLSDPSLVLVFTCGKKKHHFLKKKSTLRVQGDCTESAEQNVVGIEQLQVTTCDF